MNRIRVMVVDDAVVVRRVLTEMLQKDPDIEVVGSAPNGRIALTKLPQLLPDVLVCDVEMPEMDGLQLLAAMKKDFPRLPVLMFSSLTSRGASTTLDALALGATDYVQKPSSFLGGDDALKHCREELIAKVKATSRRSFGSSPALSAASAGGVGAARPITMASGGASSSLNSSPNGSAIGPSNGSAMGVANGNTNNALNGYSNGTQNGIGIANGLGLRTTARPGLNAAPASNAMAASNNARAGRIDVVVIGVSTGGPNALAVVLPELPANLAVPVLIVQHMPPVFTKLLAERLSAKTRIPVEECEPGQVVEAGKIWIAPGNFHMVVEQQGATVKLKTHQGPPENSCRPAVDVLFRSVAEIYGNRALAVVLTGMGQDGLKGCEVIRSAGGQVITQDEQSSVVWGMPGFVTRAGLSHKVLPLEQIAGEIVRRTQESKGFSVSRAPQVAQL